MSIDKIVATPAARRAMTRDRQRDLYGAPIGTLIRRITEDYCISQARLARTIGISPAMLSQLGSAERIKINNPFVLARLMMLDQRRSHARELTEQHRIEILTNVARLRQPYGRHNRNSHHSRADCLRGVASPQQLEAAAARLDEFPQLAEMLRQAADQLR
jgi:hypothetical protein